MGKTDHTFEHKLLLGSQGFGIWFLVSELLYLADLLFSNRCGVAHWLFRGLWKLWLCCRNEYLHCTGGQQHCSGGSCNCQCRLRKYLQGVGLLWMLWALAFLHANQLTTYLQFLGFVQAWSNNRIWWKEWLKNLWCDRRNGHGPFWC